MQLKLIVTTLIVGLIFAPYSFLRWKWGLKACLFFLPFAGVFSLYFYPNKLPLLYKDIFILVPAYLGFLMSAQKMAFPSQVLGASLTAFAAVTILQLFNPNLMNLAVGLIGVKVWLFYIPLFYLSYNLLDSKQELADLNHKLLVIGLIPCVIGIIQAVLVYAGRQDAAFLVYGKAAGPATQQFAQLAIGKFHLMRIPSTFTFVAQYSNFTFVLLALAFADLRNNRAFATKALLLIILASFLSGARGTFLLVPLLLVLMYGLYRGIDGVLKSVIIVTMVLVPLCVILFGDVTSLAKLIIQLTAHYGEELVTKLFLNALNTAAFGLGPGMSTGAARHALTGGASFLAVENYYAKSIIELGIFGFFLLLISFYFLFINGYGIYKRLKSSDLASYSAAYLSYILFMILTSVRGWHLDLDPANIYFWVIAGFLFRLKQLANDNNTLPEGS